jgi:hypothetical protein
MFRRYVELVEASPLDTDAVLDRAIVLLYTLLAPTRDEAHAIARKPYEWHMSRLQALSAPPRPDEWASLTAGAEPPAIPDDDWERQTGTNLLFDDPAGFAGKLDVLRAAGVRNVVCWMGVGGVAHEHVLRSMRLFAESVRPEFAG